MTRVKFKTNSKFKNKVGEELRKEKLKEFKKIKKKEDTRGGVEIKIKYLDVSKDALVVAINVFKNGKRIDIKDVNPIVIPNPRIATPINEYIEETNELGEVVRTQVCEENLEGALFDTLFDVIKKYI